MKEKILRVYKWILLSILLQVTVYLFINNIYLSSRNKIAESVKFVPATEQPVEIVKKEEPEKGIPIPLRSKDLKISFDRTLAAYINDGKLEILDLKEKKVKKTLSNQFSTTENENVKNKIVGNITCYKWLPDKNTLIYALSAKNEEPARVQLTTYDAAADSEFTGVTMTNNYLPSGSEITDLVISPLNMVIYSKIKVNPTQARFYRVNIMNEIYASFLTDINATAKIGRYGEILVYQDNDNRLFRKTGMYNAPVQLQFPNKMVLLDMAAVQSEGKDTIYAGELNDEGNVHKILHGKADAPVTEWTSISLKKPLKPERIVIGKTGAIMGISEDESVLYNLQDDTKTAYTGKFISIVDNHIAHLDNNLLKFTPLK